MGDVKSLLALPPVGRPPWWLTWGDRACWYTLPALLQRTIVVVTTTN